MACDKMWVHTTYGGWHGRDKIDLEFLLLTCWNFYTDLNVIILERGRELYIVVQYKEHVKGACC